MHQLVRKIRPGERFGNYEVLEEVRAGGMATLLLARRAGPAGFAREVALKVVHPHLALDPKFVEMFLAEARLGARIQHPNIAHVEELGEHNGVYFLVMEYVHGLSLAQLLDRLDQLGRSLSPELAAYIAIEVAEALHSAHQTRGPDGKRLGVVHRDVSPQNILLSNDGHVKLIDFGLAKVEGAAKTQTGTIKGKLRYMAPEQLTDRPVSPATDLYALGIVLWELLTQVRRYGELNELELVYALRRAEHPPPSSVMPGCEPLDPVVLKALAADPGDRYSNGRELAHALAEACPYALTVDSGDLAQLVSSMREPRSDDEGSTVREQAISRLTRESVSSARREEAPTRVSRQVFTSDPPPRSPRRREPTDYLIAAVLVSVALAIGIALGRFL